MINVMDSINDSMKNNHEGCLDPQLWHACAGGMVQMPSVNSKVVYFPQGHAENAIGVVDFGSFFIPPLISCRVSAIKYMADVETDEVYAKISLVPVKNDYRCQGDDDNHNRNGGNNGSDDNEKTPSFAKTLTQSDANNGGGFSVPRYCAETIFPRLDYNAEPPVQTILAKDVHGEIWKFRHIYRGTPRRHLLTTGWSNFVNQKKLVAGDSIVFMRAENGDLCVGIRRAKRGIANGHEYSTGWNPIGGSCGSPYNGYPGENNSIMMKRNCSNGDMKGKISAQSVVEAATLAARGLPFDVVYHPRASMAEFCVKASAVAAAMQIQWCPGMRFKMAFETEDSSRISWFMGTISSAQVLDPDNWPNSPWRLLQVAWDELDLLQNIKHVSPWLVELVSNVPIHLSPFAPPRKKMRLQQNPDFPMMGSIPVPSFTHNPIRSSNSVSCISDIIPVGLQGARHAQYGLSPLDIYRLQPGLFPVGFQKLERTAPPSRLMVDNNSSSEHVKRNLSCLLTMGNPNYNLKEKTKTKSPPPPHIFLFGKLILTEPESSQSCLTVKTSVSSDGSGSATNQNGVLESSSDEDQNTDLGLEIGNFKTFLETKDVGRPKTLDLSVLKSYKELF